MTYRLSKGYCTIPASILTCSHGRQYLGQKGITAIFFSFSPNVTRHISIGKQPWLQIDIRPIAPFVCQDFYALSTSICKFSNHSGIMHLSLKLSAAIFALQAPITPEVNIRHNILKSSKCI